MLPRLLAVTPGSSGDGHELVWLLEAMAGAGLRAVVLREPGLAQRDYVGLARALSPLFGPGLILHSKHPDALWLAERGGFGLHCAAGVDLRAARARVPGALGASCHDARSLSEAQEAGCDYATISPVFSPGSKPGDARPTLGLEGLRTLVSGLELPVYALGGMRPESTSAARAAGAHGVAVLGALFPPDATPERCVDTVRAYYAALG